MFFRARIPPRAAATSFVRVPPLCARYVVTSAHAYMSYAAYKIMMPLYTAVSSLICCCDAAEYVAIRGVRRYAFTFAIVRFTTCRQQRSAHRFASGYARDDLVSPSAAYIIYRRLPDQFDSAAPSYYVKDML